MWQKEWAFFTVEKGTVSHDIEKYIQNERFEKLNARMYEYVEIWYNKKIYRKSQDINEQLKKLREQSR